jgi:hypothetical protein
MKTLFNIGLCYTLLLQASLPGYASEFENGSEKVISNPVAGDLYVGGGTILINAGITGDLVAAGGTIAVNDSIAGDALLAGGNLLVNGFIGDDIRAAGGRIKINRNVNGDVVIAGGEIEIGPQALILGDLIVTSGKAIVNGTIKGQVKLYGGELYLNGIAANGLEVKGGRLFINGAVSGPARLAAERIILQQKATFQGDVQYWQQDGPLNFKKAMVTGRATFRPEMALRSAKANWYYLGFGSFVFMGIYLASALLLLFLLQFSFPGAFDNAGSGLNQGILREISYGLLYLIGLPAISVLLLITIIGIPAGIFAMFFYLFTLVMAHIITSLVIANWYKNQYHRSWTKIRTVLVALAVFIALKLILLVPFAGWLISLALVILAFGAIIFSMRRKTIPGHTQLV